MHSCALSVLFFDKKNFLSVEGKKNFLYQQKLSALRKYTFHSFAQLYLYTHTHTHTYIFDILLPIIFPSIFILSFFDDLG